MQKNMNNKIARKKKTCAAKKKCFLICDYEVKLHTGGVGRPARRIASELTLLLLMLVLMMLVLLLCRDEDEQDDDCESEVKVEDEVDEAEEDEEEVGGEEECKEEYLGSGKEV